MAKHTSGLEKSSPLSLTRTKADVIRNVRSRLMRPGQAHQNATLNLRGIVATYETGLA